MSENARARAQALADELIGTCNSLPDYVMDDGDLANWLDNFVALCETCGWWVEADEVDRNRNCEDCTT